MEIFKGILTVIYVIICIAIIILTMSQSEGDEGASSTITGSKANSNFYDKNKGRTKEGKMKSWTIILTVIFFVLTIVLAVMYAI